MATVARTGFIKETQNRHGTGVWDADERGEEVS